jgi:hypothetical protein
MLTTLYLIIRSFIIFLAFSLSVGALFILCFLMLIHSNREFDFFNLPRIECYLIYYEDRDIRIYYDTEGLPDNSLTLIQLFII